MTKKISKFYHKSVRVPSRSCLYRLAALAIYSAVLLLNFYETPFCADQISWWTKTAAPYKGTVIHGISEDGLPSVYVREKLAQAFEQETGIKVVMETVSWADMYEKSVRDMVTGRGTYDFVYIEQDIIYAYLHKGYLKSISLLLKSNPKLFSPDFSFEDFTSYIDFFKDPQIGDVYGIPFEAFPKFYLYRKDLFEKPEIQNAFHKAYGYPLAPAKTFKAYLDISEFFTKWGKDHNMEFWGTTVTAIIDHPASFYEFVETILPSFGIYNWGINQKVWKASEANGGALDSARAKEALAFMVGLLKYAPPEAKKSDWWGVYESFGAGRAAQGWIYGENTIKIADSKLAGKVGVALPPLYEGVLEEAESGKGYIGYNDGGAFGISHASKNTEATLLWLQYIGQPAVQKQWTLNAGRVVHTATFKAPELPAYDRKLGGYFKLTEEKGHLFAGNPPYHFHMALVDLMSPFIHQALTGSLSPAAALDYAARVLDQNLEQMANTD